MSGEELKTRDWLLLIVGLAVTGIASLSVHAVMLQGFGVPYPSDGATPSWARFLNVAAALAAAPIFYGLARPKLARLSLAAQCLIVFLLDAGVNEMLRGFLMNGYVSTAWIFSAVQALPKAILFLAVSILSVVLIPRVKSTAGTFAMAAAISLIGFFAIKLPVDAAFGHLLQRISYLAHDDIYQLPYGWEVLIPAYVTFIEPVVAALLIVALVWDRLPGSNLLRTILYALLILFLNAQLLRTLIFSFYTKLPLWLSFLSEGQFALETVTMAVLTAVVWINVGERLFGRRAASSFE